MLAQQARHVVGQGACHSMTYVLWFIRPLQPEHTVVRKRSAKDASTTAFTFTVCSPQPDSQITKFSKLQIYNVYRRNAQCNSCIRSPPNLRVHGYTNYDRGFASANLKGGTVVTAWNAYASGTIDDMMDERETDRFAIWFCLLLYNVALSAV